MKKSKNYIALFYVLAIFVAIPIFNKGTFENITVHKTEVFYLVSVLTLILYVLSSVIDDVTKRADVEPFKFVTSRVNIAMGIFWGTVLLSTVLSGAVKDAVYGVSGFSTGALFLTILVLSFFYISKYLECREWIFHTIVTISTFPTIVSIANRIGADPLLMYTSGIEPQYSLYVSTFGNYSWFSEYLAVIVPIAIYMFMMTKRLLTRVMYGVYLVLAGVAICLCSTKMLVVSCLAAFLIVLAWKFKLSVKKDISILPVIFIAGTILYFIVVFIASGHYDLANGRGYIWSLTLDLFKNFSVREKFIGVGPNRYMYALEEYLGAHPDAAATFYERFNNVALTSAHSEILDYLINIGVVGLLAYLYMLYTVAATFVKRGFGDECKEIAAVVAVSYFIFTLCNFSIVCAAPYFFVMLGIIADEKTLVKGESDG